MALTVNPSDYQFEVQGTKYFMRFQSDADIGEVFVAAQFDAIAKEWTGFVFRPANERSFAGHGGTMKSFVTYFISKVNLKLDENHGTSVVEESTWLEKENAYFHASVSLVNERLVVS